MDSVRRVPGEGAGFTCRLVSVGLNVLIACRNTRPRPHQRKMVPRSGSLHLAAMDAGGVGGRTSKLAKVRSSIHLWLGCAHRINFDEGVADAVS